MSKWQKSVMAGVIRLVCGCLIAPVLLPAAVPEANAQSQPEVPGLVDSSASPELSAQVNYVAPNNSYNQTLGGQPPVNNQSQNNLNQPNQNQDQQVLSGQSHQKGGKSRRGSGLGLSRLGTGLLGSMGLMGMAMRRSGGGANSGNNSSSALASRNNSSTSGAAASANQTSRGTANSYRELWWSQHGRQMPNGTAATSVPQSY